MLRFVDRITIKLQQCKKYEKNTTTKISKVSNNTKKYNKTFIYYGVGGNPTSDITSI